MYATGGTKRSAGSSLSYDYSYFGYNHYFPPTAHTLTPIARGGATIQRTPGMGDNGHSSDSTGMGMPAAKKAKPGIGALLEKCNQVNEVARRRREIETELAQMKQMELTLVGELNAIANAYEGETTEVLMGIGVVSAGSWGGG